MAKAFRENDIEYDQVNYYIDPLTAKQLESLFRKAGIRPIEAARKREKGYKELGLSDETPDKEVIDAMVANPNLLERPIVEVGKKAVVARPIEKAFELIESAA